MLLSIALPFIAAVVAPLWIKKGWHGSWLALFPLLIFCLTAPALADVLRGNERIIQYSWVPSIGLNLALHLDALSWLMLSLISGIGTAIVLYASKYLENHPDLGRFFLWLFVFMGAMVGLVLADNILLLFVFWELTSIASYMLIGFNHESAKARASALQGLLVTVGGGLALLAGMIMLGYQQGTFLLSEMSLIAESSNWITAAIVLVLLGCFTKSAQFPFQFWLPNAMAAPTPVSAYLHSATMVKAGVFLMAQLAPVFAEQIVWTTLVTGAGAITMLLGAWLAFLAVDLKKILAYTTVTALGMLTMLIGIGSDYANYAFATFLIAHALYKASLFMLAGIIEHQSHTRNLRRVRPLPRSTLVVTGMAAWSLAGIVPALGFIAKELTLKANTGDWLLTAMVFLTAVLTIAVAASLVWQPLRSKSPALPVHGEPWQQWVGPIVFSTLALLLGVFAWVVQPLADQIASQMTGAKVIELSLWYGFSQALALSGASIVLGILLASVWQKTRVLATRLRWLSRRFGSEKLYELTLAGNLSFADWQTRVLQNGYLGRYLVLIIAITTIAILSTLLVQYGWPGMSFDALESYEVGMLFVMLTATLYAIASKQRFAAIIALGAVGFVVALIFIHFSAPDLGITQVLVETLTVLLLVLVLIKLPGLKHYSTRLQRFVDATVAAGFGFMMTLLVLAAQENRWAESISHYFVEQSYPLGQGRNIVNVILVDFRALDTLGEIFVLALAALGVYSMIRLRRSRL
ncbi:hydrogen gas-evolving membrane-bound hydrogenase subunit E [Salinibius halmophilus]|uniref:hydrogen gas-evolving membrane-bound hydrogenase subunit E n=1 Tax=Salinibius halmophilus TaxID=1853216 RepID=UPI0018F3400F|nr:hydrogen gas-evolving membrane-bound hydrogenase subunit E [Salinibius halmophilus]